MLYPIRLTLVPLTAALLLAACGDKPPAEGRKVAASGKEDTALANVPQAVIDVALAARPQLDIAEAEYETRDGNEYYDLGGTLPDGSELELDMTKIDGTWTVVEFQRDIAMAQVPGAVASTLRAAVPDWQPDRIIESDQGDGTVIYEFFGPGDGDEPVKHEVKWQDDRAEMLVDEWVH